MQNFIINIYDNQIEDYIAEQIKFEGDLQTAKKFSMSLAKRLKLNDCAIFIYDANDYHIGEDCITILEICK